MAQTETKYFEFEAMADALIKAGRIGAVIKMIRSLNFARVPRDFRQNLAKICRRAGLIEEGLRLLYPLIRDEEPLQYPPTAGEICEYSVLLSRNGSVDEALSLLEKVNPGEAPEAMLYRGFCHVSKWDYARAAQVFEQYLESNADDYAKLVARVNLASAYLALEKFTQAQEEIRTAMTAAKVHQAVRLQGNLLELRGQGHMLMGNFEQARRDLNEAQSIFAQSPSYDQLLIQKWLAVIEALTNNSVAPLIRFRAEAVERKHWESVRDADLFSLKIKFDSEKYNHLIFGTPMSSYRERILNHIQRAPGSEFLLGQGGGRCLDLNTGMFEDPDGLSPGKKIHQLLLILTEDFYAPLTQAAIYAKLYPDEYFNIHTSPARVRQILKRSRRWLAQQGLPAVISQNDGAYSFKIHGAFAIRLPLVREVINPHEVNWTKLKNHFAKEARFEQHQACEKLGISRSNFHRLADWAEKQSRLQKIGRGKATGYRILKSAA